VYEHYVKCKRQWNIEEILREINDVSTDKSSNKDKIRIYIKLRKVKLDISDKFQANSR
jgi:hypothetical protein